MLTKPPAAAHKSPDELWEPRSIASKFQGPPLPPQIATCLGERLRAYYARLMGEPVPDALLRILEPLDRTGTVPHGR